MDSQAEICVRDSPTQGQMDRCRGVTKLGIEDERHGSGLGMLAARKTLLEELRGFFLYSEGPDQCLKSLSLLLLPLAVVDPLPAPYLPNSQSNSQLPT